MSKLYQLRQSTKKECGIIPGRTRQEFTILLESGDLGAAWPERNAMLHEAGYWLRFLEEKRKPPFKPIIHTTFNREACPSCQACKPSRISVQDFSPTQAHAELLQDTKLKISITSTPDAAEHLPLANAYQGERHHGDNSNVEEFWNIRHRFTECMEFRSDQGKLVAGLLFQRKQDIAVGDYYYYDIDGPDTPRKISLYIKLALLNHLRSTDTKYLYMGNWTAEPSPLTPKARLNGMEILERGNVWRRLSSKERKSAMHDYYKKFAPE